MIQFRLIEHRDWIKVKLSGSKFGQAVKETNIVPSQLMNIDIKSIQLCDGTNRNNTKLKVATFWRKKPERTLKMSLFSIDNVTTNDTNPWRYKMTRNFTRSMRSALNAWRQHRQLRALEGLSFGELKDIGFPTSRTGLDQR